MLSPDHHNPNKRGGADSGQGESDDERVRCDSDSEVEEIPANREVLRWKRGRVIGKGAFGRVCEGLMENAKLIAVKEIDLEINSSRDKVQVVNSYCFAVS